MKKGFSRFGRRRLLAMAAAAAVLIGGCFSPRQEYECPPRPPAAAYCPLGLRTLGHSIQVGAFTRADFAVRLEEKLKSQGLEAFSFLHESGLYKVRCGDFGSYEQARATALALQREGFIEEFFIVSPADYPVAQVGRTGCDTLRDEIVRTANRFLGVPYQWGGASAEEGFDCSGLAMVVYRLNGLDLPRASFHQYDAGKAVPGRELRKGDLVFFATRRPKRVSHVGIYIGGGRFIHAPRRGQRVRVSNLSSGYFAQRYMGARTYL